MKRERVGAVIPQQDHQPQEERRLDEDDVRAERIRAWIVERLYSSDLAELSAIEPMPLFDIGQVDDAMKAADGD